MQVVHSDIKLLYALVIDNSSVQELTKQISGDNNFYSFAPRAFREIKSFIPDLWGENFISRATFALHRIASHRQMISSFLISVVSGRWKFCLSSQKQRMLNYEGYYFNYKMEHGEIIMI